jgi:transposase
MNLPSKNIPLKDLTTTELISKIEELFLFAEFSQKENLKLSLELDKYKHPKNSRNSSVPPSQDPNRPKQTQSLRKKSKKKLGGQKGHSGHNLSLTDSPDEIIELSANYCNSCGEDLRAADKIYRSKRQVVDLPPVYPIYTEYRCFEKKCSCGNHQLGAYPSHVNNHIQYGPRVTALACYYSVYQYLPFKRMQIMFNQVFNLPLSQGTLVNMIEGTAKKALPIYEILRSTIESSTVIGADETGIKVNGDKFWGWIWQNINVTFIAIASGRGKEIIAEYFPNGFLNGFLVSDR